MPDERPLDLQDVYPNSLSHLIGNELVKSQIKIAIDSAFADGRPFDSTLLVAPPGLGKSATARAIAYEMGVGDQFTEVLGQSVKNLSDLNEVLLSLNDKTVLHIDEAHELNRQKGIQTALYLALDKKSVFLSGGKNGKPTPIPLADFTLILSTTEEFLLLPPLRDRLRQVLRLEYLTVDELAQVVRGRCHSLKWPVEEEVFQLIGQRARGTPRIALRLLQSCRRVCRAEGQETITSKHLDLACHLEQLDSILGLNIVEQKYLRAIADGCNRLGVLASMLGLPTHTVSKVTESFLLRAGLIVRQDGGRRELTPKGREYLSQITKGLVTP